MSRADNLAAAARTPATHLNTRRMSRPPPNSDRHTTDRLTSSIDIHDRAPPDLTRAQQRAA
jgi:hypothetical protein